MKRQSNFVLYETGKTLSAFRQKNALFFCIDKHATIGKGKEREGERKSGRNRERKREKQREEREKGRERESERGGEKQG